MAKKAPGPARIIPLNSPDAGVAPLELYFDLVFVFALTQVTVLMASGSGAEPITRGLLVLGMLWASWAGYAWLGNLVVVHTVTVRTLLLTAMSAMFILALSIPEAFTDAPGGWSGPLVLASCYFVFRGLHLLMYWFLSKDDPRIRGQLIRFASAVLVGNALIFAAGTVDDGAQTAFWVLALAADYIGVLIGGGRGWRLQSTSHFSERHGQIVIIALGESILAIGVAVRGDAISGSVVTAAVLGLILATSMWWIYFDISAEQAEEALASAPDEAKPQLARNAYSLLHLPLVAGIVLVALGLKNLIHDAGIGHGLAHPLNASTRFALFCGLIVYLAAHMAFRWNTARRVHPGRALVLALLAGLWVGGPHVSGTIVLGSVALLMAALVTCECVAYSDERRVLRTARYGAHPRALDGNAGTTRLVNPDQAVA